MNIGIFGGTFDPPHFGHLNLAEEAVMRLSLDRLFFVPAAVSPHKAAEPSNPPEIRYRMTALAVRNHPVFDVSDVELKRKPPSYTVDTLRYFREQFPYPHELFFLAGSDVLEKLHSWKDISIILEMCRFVVLTRPGNAARALPDGVRYIEIDELDVSGRDVRARIKQGQDVNDLVPLKVLAFIEKRKLYR